MIWDITLSDQASEELETETPVSNRADALKAVEVLQSYLLDRGEHWAHSLKNDLSSMTMATRHEQIQSLKLTVMTDYFHPKLT